MPHWETGSANLSNAGEFDDRGLPLPLRKREGFLAICVRPGKAVAVMIENRRQPMAVLPVFIFSEFRSLAVYVHLADSTTVIGEQATLQKT